MKLKVVLVAMLAVALVGMGALAGSIIGTSHALAQAPLNPSAAAQTAPLNTSAAAVQAAPPSSGSTAQTAPPSSGSTAQTVPPSGGSTAPSAQTPAITQQQAEAAALAAAPGNTVDHTSLQTQNGTQVYDVDFANGGGAIVDATTGKIISSEAANADKGGHGGFGGGADQAALAAQAKVTQAQAEAAAIAAAPGSTVDHTRLFSNNGSVAYDVDFSNGGGAIVDAVTGKIITSEAAGTDHPNGGRGQHGPPPTAP